MKYEVMYIVKASVDDELRATINQELANAFTSNGGQVLETKELGLKELAYEIEHEKTGFYVWLNVEANGAACKEFTRRANINENVIRHIVVRDER
jgi:small subunit ribosomal protein S6